MATTVGDVRSAVSSLKKIVTIVSGLAITNTLASLMSSAPGPRTLRVLTALDWRQLLLSLVLIVTIIRFHHGNVRLLDQSYLLDEGAKERRQLLPDFAVIFAMSVLLALMSFLIHDFFALFVVLLFIDIIWFVIYLSDDTERTGLQRKWLLNNIIVAVTIFCTLSFWSDSPVRAISNARFGVLVALVLINAIVDFYYNRKVYFPNLPT
jgi:hypothetical protein